MTDLLANKPTAVVFDFYETLVQLTTAQRERIFDDLAAAAGARLAPGEAYRHWQKHTTKDAVLRLGGSERPPLDGDGFAFATFRGVWLARSTQLFAHWGVEADGALGADACARAHAGADLYPDARPALDALRGRYKLAVLSDADAEFLSPCLDRHALAFDAVVTSEEVGAYKPHVSLFREVCARLGVEPAQAVYVGDTPWADSRGRAQRRHARRLAQPSRPRLARRHPATGDDDHVARRPARRPRFAVTRWYESTDHMEDRAALLAARLGPETLARLHSVRPASDPEERFTELVRRYSTPDGVVVDIGAGDGSWLLANVAPLVRRAVGLDYSARRVWLALQQRRALAVANVNFMLADARRIPLRDGVAMAIISRRGPWTAGERYFAEGLRLLQAGGLALEIGIGEQNARELNAAFGRRSQMYEWHAAGKDRLAEQRELYERNHLDLLVAESHLATELLPSREALEYRLITSPAVEGFDPKADAPLIERIVAEHGGPDGVLLTVHRLCLVARKKA